ncbi:FAD-dependent oxidoreductase [Micromonospora zamorensis]|uniref:FAD-dependent oxidoreductase n=1 Tax=Micromonospora zamorensis TaxID=709883 RepID=UPI0033BE69CA
MSLHFTRRRVLLIGGSSLILGGGAVAGAVALTNNTVKADLVVFGGTAAGIVAAVQARRMGRAVVVIEPGTHIGGMTTGGLGNTDVGITASIGGIAGEFYRRIYAKYNRIVLTPTSPMRFTFEPHVAQAVLDDLIREAGVPVYTGHRLRRVHRRGTRIVGVETENGQNFAAPVFIDASYEGDLMARAGVSWVVGRESGSEFDEKLNGFQLATEHQHFPQVSPYRVEGVAASGLLPGISTSVVPNGTGDERIQAYNFRMCLTQAPERIPFPKPSGYDPADYTLLRRLINTGYTGSFFNSIDVGGGKTDSNNDGSFSTDYVGANYTFPTASYAQRDSIKAEHVRYQQGLMWFLANDPDLPPWVRSRTGKWGLAHDEFSASGGWPPQLYVREARRMRSAYVITEHDSLGATNVADSVGMGSYMVDSHICQRVVVDGRVFNEGVVAVPVRQPYPISYRSIVPTASQCTNILVPVCLSATHAAYGSIRMEPVFMVLAQSAATAAMMASDKDLDVQDVDYGLLASRLRADEQILRWPEDAGEVILDSAAPGVTRAGKWSSGTTLPGYYAIDYEHTQNTAGATSSITFVPQLPAPGTYSVYLRWTATPGRASNVPVDILHAGGTAKRTVDQRMSGGEWVSVGAYRFTATKKDAVRIRTNGVNGSVVADAVRFVADKAR